MKKVAMVVLALLIAVGGVLLAWYAEADDAPAGVVIGWGLVAGAFALGVRACVDKKRG